MSEIVTALEVHDLRKSYGALTAVDGLSFEVQRGEIFGVVGPNGAGKTTTIECAEGLRRPDSGSLAVLGLDPRRDRRKLHERIGIQLQESSLAPRIRVWEALALFASLYRRSVPWGDLLERLDLAEKRDAYFTGLSGGQKQRLFIALALVNDPDLVFFDELTTGLDPHARRSMWDLVRSLRDQGKTVILSTHFMEEAERLCDRVAIVDHGRIVALDSPARLIASLGDAVRLVLTIGGDPGLDALRRIEGVTFAAHDRERLEIEGNGSGLSSRVLHHLIAAGSEIHDLRTEQATLEDVFLALTGRRPQEQEERKDEETHP
jgi:ABC-2 type transport system ATP-binding protein